MIWDPSDSYILVGTMAGSLYRINTPADPSSEPIEVLNIQNTIVCLGWSGEKLAIGSTQGELKVYDMATDSPVELLSFLAHAPSETPPDQNFGSLTLFSEIWTLCWSPKGRNLLATGSEDQTVVIWDLNTVQKVTTLPKHRNAVTGVAWKEVGPEAWPGLSELFVSCSDDQQLRVYDPETWTMLHTFRTTFICEWHTLTYLALEEGGTRVAVVSQNGYFFLYEIPTKTCLFGEKVHSGSVEGLVWVGNKAATVSSDCSISLMTLSHSIGGLNYPSHRL